MLGFLKQRFCGSKKAARREPSVQLMLEEFESRFMPNAGPLSAGMNPPPFAGPPAHAGNAAASSSDPSSQCMGQGQTQTLVATLTGATGTSGTATLSSNTTAGTNNLLVKVSGLTASSSYNVAIGGTNVGQISTDANGNGQLSLKNVSSSVTSGSTITVLDSTGATVLSGTFGASTNSSANHLASGNTVISTDASVFAQDLLSGNVSGALAALSDFEAYLSSTPSSSLQEMEALMFLDQVLADLA